MFTACLTSFANEKVDLPVPRRAMFDQDRGDFLRAPIQQGVNKDGRRSVARVFAQQIRPKSPERSYGARQAELS